MMDNRKKYRKRKKSTFDHTGWMKRFIRDLKKLTKETS